MEVEICEPQTKKQFEEYYTLRWRLLRKPWNQQRGSEKDERENESIHIAAVIGGKFIGVGRVHFNSKEEAQIRYMAVLDNYRGKGVGSQILGALEARARTKGAKYILLNSREAATGFYEKHGYKIIGSAHMLFGIIPHWKMKKEL